MNEKRLESFEKMLEDDVLYLELLEKNPSKYSSFNSPELTASCRMRPIF